MVPLIILLLTILIIFLYLKSAHNYWRNRNVYNPPTNFLFGNVQNKLLGKESTTSIVMKLYREIKSRNLPFGGFYNITSPIFIPADIDLVRKILITDFQHFTDRFAFTNEENDPISGNLFSLGGAKWKALRNKLTPLFSTGKLKNMFQTVADCTKEFPHILDKAVIENQPLDIKDLISRYTIDVIGSIAFGINCNCMKNKDTEFNKLSGKFFQTSYRQIFKRTLFTVFPNFMKQIGLKITEQEVENFFMNIVRETIEFREQNNVERNDLMQLLINLRNDELKFEDVDKKYVYHQNGLSFNEIVAQAFIFYFAGFETSSTTINFLMYEIVQKPEIQEKLRQEIVTVLQKYDGIITYDSIQEMSFLDQCLNEAMRKYPALPVTFRVCTKNYEVQNSKLTIEKGTQIVIPIYGIHKDSEHYPNPEMFDPERFSKENKSKIPLGTFFPFGDGPRICIGLKLGILQTKIGLVALLKDYQFTLNSKTKTPLEFDDRSLIIKAKGGVWVDVCKV